MADDEKTIRPWKTIATELTKETDPKRVLDLALELNCALKAEQRPKQKGQDNPSA